MLLSTNWMNEIWIHRRQYFRVYIGSDTKCTTNMLHKIWNIMMKYGDKHCVYLPFDNFVSDLNDVIIKQKTVFDLPEYQQRLKRPQPRLVSSSPKCPIASLNNRLDGHVSQYIHLLHSNWSFHNKPMGLFYLRKCPPNHWVLECRSSPTVIKNVGIFIKI